jgi:uncharacterized protein YjbI with pentapeptide repeats
VVRRRKQLADGRARQALTTRPVTLLAAGSVTLRADCSRCFGLCCVAPAFAAGADFAIDKPAGEPCPNLTAAFRCGIHEELRQRGFPGCTAYDCFGAGQRVSQSTFGGRDWRSSPEIVPRIFQAFGIMRQLHELLWYLTEALGLSHGSPLHDQLAESVIEIEELSRSNADALAELDVAAYRASVTPLLVRVSEVARAGIRGPKPDHSGADLIGVDLRGAQLRGANLRSARLIGADLRGADLRGADLLAVDFRGANLRGADLTGSVFLTQSQLDTAVGDASTRIPPSLRRPRHWNDPSWPPSRERDGVSPC